MLVLILLLLLPPCLEAISFSGWRGTGARANLPDQALLHDGGLGISVLMDGEKLSVGPLGAAGALAEAYYVDALQANTRSGYGHLEVWTAPLAGDEAQMEAAGFVEGWITAERISQHYANLYAFFNLTSEPAVGQFLEQQQAWVRSQAAAAGGQDDGLPSTAKATSEDAVFWRAVRLLLAQFDGILAGYNARAAQANAEPAATSQQLPHLSQAEFYFLCSLGDIGDIKAAVEYQQAKQHVQQGKQGQQAGSRRAQQQAQGQPQEDWAAAAQRRLDSKWDGLSPHDVAQELALGDRCSALVKVSPDFSEVWVGQAAWYTYAAMLRVFKHYSFALSDPGILSRSLGFSSYYGELSSDDDFYLLGGSNLTVLQATNRIMDATLLDLIRPESVLSWQRVRAANAVAGDGESWARAVATHNSGTYTNTWLVAALGSFQPGKPLPAGLLTVVEQVPGNVFWEDATRVLEAGYFALYNVPVLPQTYETLGYPAFVAGMASKGPAYEAAASGAVRQTAPRAKLFRRDHSSVTSLAAMQDLMRSNNWKTDPFSANMSTNAICGRGDVDPVTPRAAGCYDGKVANLHMALALEAQIINGPPHSPSMPPFGWAEAPWASAVPHAGQPDRFAFDWERVAPLHATTAQAKHDVA